MTSSVTENRSGPRLNEREELRRQVSEVVGAAPVVDMHTHLYAPEFGGPGRAEAERAAARRPSGNFREWVERAS